MFKRDIGDKGDLKDIWDTRKMFKGYIGDKGYV